ncbi:MAG: LuxR C-terminal-related transcriptional regulator, partial [Candidatus Limnocylindrales bacterium]
MREGRLDRQAIDDTLASGLAVEVDPAPGEGGTRPMMPDIGIAHELYAEAIDALALPHERHAIHASLGASTHVTPAEAAWHRTMAWQRSEARDAHLVAARAALRLDPGETTLYQYQAALDLGDSGDPAETSSDLATTLHAASHAAANAGSFRRAAALVKRAIDARPRRAPSASLTSRTPDERAATLEAQRAEKQRQAELYEHFGRFRWAGGDLVGGLQRMRESVEMMPDHPTQALALAQAVLAQHLMLDGSFGESADIAKLACETAAAVGTTADGELGHATCTLGVDMAYLGQFDRGLEVLEQATDIARRSGRLDDLMRAYANRTTLLDLDSRREQALAVVNEGMRDARAAGLGATYGAFLRGNAADILFNLGRWEESERECRAGMAYRPGNAAWFSPILYLGLVLVESRADEEATRLVGQTLLQLEQVPAGQWTALVLRAAVSLLLWRGDAADAVDVCAREWDRVQETADPLQIAMACSTALEAAAALAESARETRDFSAVATAGELAKRVLVDAEHHVARSTLPRSLGARREAELHLDVARAHLLRLQGRASASRWDAIATAWSKVPVPYLQAKARWWQALAELQFGDGRAAAQAPLQEAWRISGDLPAAPLRQALAELSRRARIRLPGTTGTVIPIAFGPLGPMPAMARPSRPFDDEPAAPSATAERLLVAVGPGRPTFDLSQREMEVLESLAEGRTNREIADRLFISHRTVGVHVRHILAKLSVAGRTEATSKAIRFGLVSTEPLEARVPLHVQPRGG